MSEDHEGTDESTTRVRVAAFHRLHESGIFVMPNPWDAGSAIVLEQLGFPALASTSSGAAWARGRPDNTSLLEGTLQHLRELTAVTTVPVNADFERGFAMQPDEVADNVSHATGTGIAGLSIEDSTGDRTQPLFDFTLAVERVAAARQAVDDSGTGVLLTARTEGYVVGRADLAETVRRLRAFAEAGADCLYAPGITAEHEISAVVEAASGTPVNLLVHTPFITVDRAASLGVRRISVGGALARSAWGGWLAAAREIGESGTFTHFQGLPDVNGLF